MKATENIRPFIFCSILSVMIALPGVAQQEKQKLEQQRQELNALEENAKQEQQQANKQKQQFEQQREKIESQRIAFITQELDLTPAEAQAFWPVYNEYDKKRHELNKQFRKQRQADDRTPDQLTEKEAADLADQQLVEAQKMLDLRKEYHAKFKSVLPPRKLLKLYDSERDFQKVLLKRLRDDRAERCAPERPARPSNMQHSGGGRK